MWKEGHFRSECRSKAKTLINSLFSDQTGKEEILKLLELSTLRVTNPVVLVTMKSTNLTNFPRYGSVAPIMTLPSKTSREEYQVL